MDGKDVSNWNQSVRREKILHGSNKNFRVDKSDVKVETVWCFFYI